MDLTTYLLFPLTFLGPYTIIFWQMIVYSYILASGGGLLKASMSAIPFDILFIIIYSLLNIPFSFYYGLLVLILHIVLAIMLTSNLRI